MIYLAVFILLIIFTYRYDYCCKTKWKAASFFAVLLLFILIAGLRYRIGTDSVRYETYFEKINPVFSLSESDFQNTRYAPLYIFLTSLVKTFTSDFMIFQFLHAGIVVGVVGWFIRKNTEKVFFALLLFFIFLYLTLLTEVLRESLAVCVFLLSWRYYCRRNWLVWYGMSVIAILFHTSAVMMLVLPVCCVPGFRNIFVFGLRTIPVCVVLILVVYAIQRMFFQYIQLLAISENISERAEVYSKTDLAGTTVNMVGVLGQIVRYIAYPVIALYFLKKDNNFKSPNPGVKFSDIEMMVMVSIFISIVSIMITIFSRYQNYFFIFAILLISDFAFSKISVGVRKVRLNFLYWMLLFTPLIGLQIYGGYFSNANKSGTLKTYMAYYPYHSRIDMNRDANREKLLRYNRSY